MSTEAVQRAFQDPDVTGTRAQVLTYLCWRANEEGVAWPKRSTIAEAVNVSEKQVKRHVKALVSAGKLWYRPGRGRGNASTYVPCTRLEKGDIALALRAAGLEKGDADDAATEVVSRRKGDTSPEKGDTDGGEDRDSADEKGDTQGQKAPTDGAFSKKGTPEKRGHSGEEKGTPVRGFSDPPNDNISNPPEEKTRDRQSAAAAGAQAREDGSGADPDVFAVEVDSVDAITEAAFGEPIRALTMKDEIRTYCERAGPEGWDCLRSACAMINRKGWNPTAALVKKKLIDQLNLLNESDESDDKEPDDFASQTQRLRKAARRGAGLDG